MNRNIIISNKLTLMDALSIMDKNNRKLLVICDGETFQGVVSIGDIQRAILSKQDLSAPVSNFGRNTITFASVEDDTEKIKEVMRKDRIEAMPVVDKQMHLVDIIEWEQVFSFNPSKSSDSINIPVVVMAGGKGTRLLPLTNVIPKPLIPISDKTIIEEIMCRFREAGCQKFYISVNYLMEEIEKFFNDKTWDIDYIYEHKPLGTGGALYYLTDRLDSTFFVINCDTLVDVNLNDLVSYHKNNKNIITVVSAIKTIHIPYGTLETGDKGVINELKEKPDYVYQVNCGFYVLEPSALKYVAENEFMNITDLIDRVIKDGKRVGAFPVPEGSWVDMGNWDEYLKLVNRYLESANIH